MERYFVCYVYKGEEECMFADLPRNLHFSDILDELNEYSGEEVTFDDIKIKCVSKIS